RIALPAVSDRAGSDQLAALLGPNAIAASEDPRCADIAIIVWSADDGGIAICGQRDGCTLQGLSDHARSDQFAALLGPNALGADVDKRCSHIITPIEIRPTHDGGVTVGRHRNTRKRNSGCYPG